MFSETIQSSTRMRQIKSFVRREGRMTKGQKRALDSLWLKYGINTSKTITCLHELFGRNNTKILEIGFGMGESLAQMAEQEPSTDFIGIEVHRPGVGSLISTAQKYNLQNLKIFNADAVDVLDTVLPDRAFDRIQIFFPDPWPKKRHHKRRLIQTPFVKLLAEKLKSQAILHVATDWQNYAEHIKEILDNYTDFVNSTEDGGFAPRPNYRPVTKFEQRGNQLGHGVWDIIYRRR